MSHESSSGSQHQNTGAEVLVERQKHSPDVSGELWEQEGQESKGPLKETPLAGNKFPGKSHSNLTTEENSSEQSHPAVQSVHVGLRRFRQVVTVESSLG